MNARGFTLIESLFASLVVTVVMLGAAYSFSTAYSYIDQGGEFRTATLLTQQRVEWLRNQGYASSAMSAGTVVEQLSGVFIGYERTTEVLDNTPVAGVKQITVTVESPSGMIASSATLVGS